MLGQKIAISVACSYIHFFAHASSSAEPFWPIMQRWPDLNLLLIRFQGRIDTMLFCGHENHCLLKAAHMGGASRSDIVVADEFAGTSLVERFAVCLKVGSE
ncbi:hypothetical protein CK231_10405 [Mesorhizobium loti]|nr:hypothetical protein CK231_10405 [Mesorhizobium loti]PBC07385.1 hypothetical protein CK230_27395 [Mesorhizobium sp. WSM3859]